MTNTSEVQPNIDDFATMSINGDSYIVLITNFTPKTVTVQGTRRMSDGTYKGVSDWRKTFRWNEKRQAYIHDKYFRLTLGVAVERRDPSF